MSATHVMRASLMRVALVVLVVMLATVAARPLHAQPVTGDTVRLSLGYRSWARGTFVRDDSTSLHVLPLTGRDTMRYALDAIERAEVLRGRRRGGTAAIGRGALRGAGVGLALGIANALFTTPTRQGDTSVGDKRLGVVVLPVLGAGLGFMLALPMAFAHEEVWVEVPIRAR
jgi:hypothetical protein